MLTEEQREKVINLFSTAASFNGQALRDFVRKAAHIILDLHDENEALKRRIKELEQKK